MGVWIETPAHFQTSEKLKVTPCMGVWIETLSVLSYQQPKRSHPVWVCGLKQFIQVSLQQVVTSHPVWVCGLKPDSAAWAGGRHQVTPCMGVWIETNRQGGQHTPTSHTLYGCVDWNKILHAFLDYPFVTPCMGVWIETRALRRFRLGVWVTPCMGVWIETCLWFALGRSARGHTLYGCVDWNSHRLSLGVRQLESHPVWVCGLKHK